MDSIINDIRGCKTTKELEDYLLQSSTLLSYLTTVSYEDGIGKVIYTVNDMVVDYTPSDMTPYMISLQRILIDTLPVTSEHGDECDERRYKDTVSSIIDILTNLCNDIDILDLKKEV